MKDINKMKDIVNFIVEYQFNEDIDFIAHYERAVNGMLVPVDVKISYKYDIFEDIDDLIYEIPELENIKQELEDFLVMLYSKTYNPEDMIKCLL